MAMQESNPNVQQMALTIVPKLTASLSLIGSLMIVSQVLQSKTNRSNPQQRLVLAISCLDILVSTSWLFTNFLVPPWSTDYYYSFGNQATCSLQGFVVQMSIGGVLYNAVLALYYVLVIKLQWQTHQIQRIEPYLHACPLLFGLGTAVAGLALNLYNPASWDCWIAAYPPECQQSYDTNDGQESDCLRGDNADIYQWVFFFGPLWVCIGLTTMAMAIVCWEVHTVEQKVQNWRMTSKERRHSQTRQIAVQSLLYVSAFYVTWLWPTVARIVQLAEGTIPDWLITLAGCFIPVQGFFNALVYFRPRYLKCSETHSDQSRWWVLRRIGRNALFCCLAAREELYYRQDGRDIEEPLSIGVEPTTRNVTSVTRCSINNQLSLSHCVTGAEEPRDVTDPDVLIEESSEPNSPDSLHEESWDVIDAEGSVAGEKEQHDEMERKATERPPRRSIFSLGSVRT